MSATASPAATPTITPADTPTGTPTPTPTPLCGAMPLNGCHPAGRAILLIKNKAGTGNQLSWKWLQGSAPVAELGGPTSTMRYALCVCDAVSQVSDPKLPVRVAPGGTCRSSPCRSFVGGSGTLRFRFSDGSGQQQGLKKLMVR